MRGSKAEDGWYETQKEDCENLHCRWIRRCLFCGMLITAVVFVLIVVPRRLCVTSDFLASFTRKIARLLSERFCARQTANHHIANKDPL